MRAQEKAKELVDRFKNNSKQYWNENDKETYHDVNAKDCALIAVEEIIATHKNRDLANSLPNWSTEYWQEVKESIREQ